MPRSYVYFYATKSTLYISASGPTELSLARLSATLWLEYRNIYAPSLKDINWITNLKISPRTWSYQTEPRLLWCEVY